MRFFNKTIHNKMKPYKAAIVGSCALLAPTAAFANNDSGRGLLDLVLDLITLVKTSGQLGYYTGMFLAICLFVAGCITWWASGKGNGDPSKTKGAAVGLLVISIVLGSMTQFFNMGSNTATKQNSEIVDFLSES